MEQEAPEHAGDEVQVFDVNETLQHPDGVIGRTDMATSANCYIAVFQTPPRGGETHIHQHPDSDQILFILRGECTVEGLSGQRVLTANQGVLIPAGVNYGFTNTAQEDLVFLSMRTESSGGRRVAYVPNVPSDIAVKVPESMVGAQGLGRHVFMYAIDRSTIGISPLLIEEWNRASFLRMHCEFQRANGYITVFIPERFARWYRLEDFTEADYLLLPEPDGDRVRVDLSPLIKREASRSA